MTTPSERGAVIKQFPRTLSIKNWPFLLLVLIVVGIPAGLAWNPWWGGNIWMAVAVLGVGPFTVAILGLPQVAVELLGSHSLYGVYENGLCTRRIFKEYFVLWDEVESVKTRLAIVWAQGPIITFRVFDIRVKSIKKPVVLDPRRHGKDTAMLIAKKAGIEIRSGD